MDIEIHQIPEDLCLSYNQLENIIINSCHELHFAATSISYIFVSDIELAEMHGKFLDNNSNTDVITFNLDEEKIEGEIYISSDRAKDQALQYNVSYQEEVVRLMIHGILHLAGYDDIEEDDLKELKREENNLLNKMRRYY